jgi:hypothetical protein
VVCVGAIATTALGQQRSNAVQRLERQLREVDSQFRVMISPDQPIAERLLVDFGGTYRFGLYAIDDPGGSTRLLRLYDTRLHMRAELDGAHRFFGRLRFLYEDWNSGDSFDGRDDEFINPIGERYWYQFDLRGAVLAQRGERLPYNVNIKAGKQLVNWGTGLTLSNPLYAALVDGELADFGLIGLVGISPSSDTVDFDGSRPGFDVDTSRSYVGGAVEYRGSPNHRPYGFVLYQRDQNDQDFTVFDGPLGPIPTSFHYDSTYIGLGSRGTLGASLRYYVEAVYELGDGLSNSFNPATGLAMAQTFEDIEAWAGVAGLTWLLRDDADTRIDIEIIAGSGDDDRLNSSDTFGGNLPGTDDEAFNTLGYLNTGLVLAPDVANLLSMRLSLSAFPFRGSGSLSRAQFGISGFLFNKLDKNAPLNFTTTDNTFIGGELDFFLDWRVASDVNVYLRYGMFFPGDAIPCCSDGLRHFVYAGVGYAF